MNTYQKAVIFFLSRIFFMLRAIPNISQHQYWDEEKNTALEYIKKLK